jgi:TonB family protein
MKLKKLNIMKTRPDISDEEIRTMMDFNSLLQKHKAGSPVNPWKFIIPGALAIAIAAWIMWPQQIETKPEVVVEQKPEVRKPAEVPKEPSVESKPAPTQAKPKLKTEPAQPPPTDVYSEAEPLKGYPDLYAYFQKELTYPVEALKDSIEGVVSVSFVIGKAGKPEQIRIQNSLGAAFDKEAIRVITGMPEWNPATLNGKPVPARISMPLTFQINRTSKP